MGRFTSPDLTRGNPQTPQDWNRFGYATANPATRVDSDGRTDAAFCDLERRGGAWGNVDSAGNLKSLGRGLSNPSDAAFVAPFFALNALAAVPIAGELISDSAASILSRVGSALMPLAVRPVSLEQSIDRGLVRSGTVLESVLGNIERGFGGSVPRSATEALIVVTRAAESLGLSAGVLSKGSDGSFLLKNVGGVTTTILKTGEIIVTRGADVVLRLIPR